MKKSIFILSIVLLLLSSLSLNIYAASYPSLSTVVTADNYAYVIYTVYTGEISARVVTDDADGFHAQLATFNVTTDYDFSITSNSGPLTVSQYILRDGAWVLTSTSNIAQYGYSYFENIASSTIYETTKDIGYVNSDEVFFPLTLPETGLLETTLEMITVETPEVGTKVVAQMKTILLCGVGCLALLIALLLLVRVLRRFLAR